MDTAFDILQALGIGVAVGIRPFLPALLIGALAAGDVGVDFEHTDFAFLEKPAFLVVMLVGLVLSDFARRRAGDEAFESGGVRTVALAFVVAAIAALLGAGSVADHDGPVAVGLALAAVASGLTLYAVIGIFGRVRARLGAEAGLLPVYREALALLAAGLSVLFPPLAIVLAGGVAFLLAGGRRREGEKYAGLRILR